MSKKSFFEETPSKELDKKIESIIEGHLKENKTNLMVNENEFNKGVFQSINRRWILISGGLSFASFLALIFYKNQTEKIIFNKIAKNEYDLDANSKINSLINTDAGSGTNLSDDSHFDQDILQAINQDFAILSWVDENKLSLDQDEDIIFSLSDLDELSEVEWEMLLRESKIFKNGV